MSDLQAKFELACEEIKAFVGKLPDNTKLDLYGFFKQTTVGDVNTSKPGMFNLKDKAKWEAWNSKKGMPQEQAKQNYVNLVKANVTPDIAANL